MTIENVEMRITINAENIEMVKITINAKDIEMRTTIEGVVMKTTNANKLITIAKKKNI